MPSNIYQPRPSTLTLEAQSGQVGMDEAVYINTNESLEITVVSSVGGNAHQPNPPVQGIQVSIDVRMLTVTNGLQYLTFMVNPTQDYVTNTFQIKLPEGFLLSASAYATGVVQQTAVDLITLPQIGQTWVSLSIVAPTQPNQFTGTFLTQGYITANQRVSYPVPQPISYDDGLAFARSLPSAFNQTQYNVPLHAVDEITGLYFNVRTTASTSNRQVFMNFVSTVRNVSTGLLVYFNGTQGANITGNYYAAQGIDNTMNPGAPNNLFAILPQRLRMRYSDFLLIAIGAGDGNDVIGNLTVWGNEWLMA